MVNKQDYLNAVTQDIDMVRGDTLAFNFILSGLRYEAAYKNLYVQFAAREHYDESIIFQSVIGDGISLAEYNRDRDEAIFNVYISPNKTANIDIGRYYYDLKICDTTNKITLMRGSLTLLFNVT